MTIVSGQIEPLKKLKATLRQEGMTRFSFIGDINHFTSNYESERKAIAKRIQTAFDTEISELQPEQAVCQNYNQEDFSYQARHRMLLAVVVQLSGQS
jgi:hypothetical protein